MKTRLTVLALVACGMVLALTNSAWSGDEGKKPVDPMAGMSLADMQKMMEQCQAQQKPGEQHKVLEHFVGDWEIETKVWMGGPGTDPMTSKGSSKMEWVLGKRFVQETMHSSMMGQPYDGLGLVGHNNVRGVYEGSWTSSMDTHITTMVGTLHPDSKGEMKVFDFYGEMDEPMMGMYGRFVNYRTTIMSKDKHKFEIFDLAAGPEFKVIEVMYTRK